MSLKTALFHINYGSKNGIKQQEQQILKFKKNIASLVDDSINHAIDLEISEKYQ